MTNSKSTVVEFYTIIYNADSSFQRLNRVIRKYNYEIDQILLPEFEKAFRPLFNLEAYDENKHRQNAVVSCNNTRGELVNFAITEEFYQILVAYYGKNNQFFRSGHVTVLKTKKIFHKDSKSEWLDIGIVIQDIERLKNFTAKLASCLRFARYGSIECHFHFANIVDEQRIIPLKDIKSGHSADKMKNFVDRDNALISALLNIDYKITGYMQFAINSFEESFHIQNLQIRFIHLLNCLEICFHTSHADSSAQVVARYSSLLVSINKREFYSLYTELINLFGLKKKILAGELENGGAFNETEQLNEKIIFIEELSRNVMKKLLYMNIKTKEELFYKLDLKTLPGQFIHNQNGSHLSAEV